MATLTRGINLSTTETVTAAKLHALVDNATISGIVNADVAAGAAISGTKLDQDLSGYVGLDTTQTISGDKTFTGMTVFNPTLPDSNLSKITTAGKVSGSSITELGSVPSGSTALPITSGGTSATTAQAAINALTSVSSATNEHVLTKDTATGNAIFKEVSTLHNPFTAGDTFLVYSLDGTGSTTTSTPTLKKSIKLTRGGVLRIKFAINSGSGGTGHAQIYRNGSPVGQDRSNAGSSPITFSEDISGWLPGDACQLYAWTIGGAGYYREFRIYSTTPSTEQTIADL